MSDDDGEVDMSDNWSDGDDEVGVSDNKSSSSVSSEYDRTVLLSSAGSDAGARKLWGSRPSIACGVGPDGDWSMTVFQNAALKVGRRPMRPGCGYEMGDCATAD